MTEDELRIPEVEGQMIGTCEHCKRKKVPLYETFADGVFIVCKACNYLPFLYGPTVNGKAKKYLPEVSK